MVPSEGVEPPIPCGRWILGPTCMPVPPRRHCSLWSRRRELNPQDPHFKCGMSASCITTGWSGGRELNPQDQAFEARMSASCITSGQILIGALGGTRTHTLPVSQTGSSAIWDTRAFGPRGEIRTPKNECSEHSMSASCITRGLVFPPITKKPPSFNGGRVCHLVRTLTHFPRYVRY